MKIQSRLLLLTISVSTIAILIALLVSTSLTQEALVKDAEAKLSAVLNAKHSALRRHLERNRQELQVLSEEPPTARYLAALTQGYDKLGKNAQTLLQQNYLKKNVGDKVLTSLSMQKTTYAHALRGADRLYLQRHAVYGWYDVFLVDPKGNVVFSLAKEGDFATNLFSGPWKETGLARAVTPLLHDAVPGTISFADYTLYAPSGNKPASFLAMPVFDHKNQTFLGVVAIRLPIEPINALMKERNGLGATGETFVVGKDGWMLTDSRFRQEGSKLSTQIKAKAVSQVLSGESGLGFYPDYRGTDVLVAFKPLRPFGDVAVLGDHPVWGVIAKIDKAEVYAQFYLLRQNLLFTGVLLLLFALFVGIWGARSLTRPLIGIRDALAKLSRGESSKVPGLTRRDEIGEMAQAAEAFRKMTQQVEREHWIAENVTLLTGAVSAQTAINKAADTVLHLLCEKLEVPVGAIYLLSDDAYQRVAAHGMARRSQTEATFESGMGIVGQCAKDNQAVVLSPVPSGLSLISTGLAEFPPHELVFYPISHKGAVLAVLELAAAKSLDSRQHEFLKTASEALGLYLANLQAFEHNLILLDETQKQSAALTEQQGALLKSNEEMHALTEELRSQTEEMKAQNEELKANQEELRAQQEEMQHKNQMLEAQGVQLEAVLAEAKNKAKDLARANQYKSEFLANMSHELRTPLNSVLILSKDLAENDESNLTPEQVESATVISESGAQLLTLINDILDLSKIEAGKLELNNESFRLDDFLAYLRRLFAPQADKKQLAFNVDVAVDLPETIHTDRQRLTQIMSNLLSNAIKFTGRGEVSVSVIKDHDDLVLDVVDSGIGVPADRWEHIFGAFQQMDGSTSRKYGGSGLGLAISRHLCTLLGGEISVSSQPDKGSRFTVRLYKQCVNPVAETIPAPAEITAVNACGRILVVEDDVRLLAILGRMIKALGFEPQCVESAEQALIEIGKQIPMGILLDLGLPYMNGMALLRQLKEGKATTEIPVYIMSGAADSGEANVLGALGFLKKPVTRDAIAVAVKVMLAADQVIKRVLLVDENPLEINSMRALFKHDAVEIVVAKTGGSAIQLLPTQPFDVVILDLNLPDMTGFEWLKQARPLLNPPPVIIYSARELSEIEVFELKEVAECIIKKGASNERLREEILRAMTLESSAIKIQSPTSQAPTGKKLLVVDDDARNLFALTKVLRAKGYSVEVAPDSIKALDALNQTRFDAVLTDIMMPEIDGYELIRQIRNLGYDDIPIIAITAKAMQGDDVLCMQAGATAYLSKPIDMGKLVELLKDV
ncbi:MAG: response regulator [Gallionella sp.]